MKDSNKGQPKSMGNKQNEQSLERLVEGLRLNEDSPQESNNYDGEGGDSSSD